MFVSGMKALIQFSDTETATSAKDSLDGRCIPRYCAQALMSMFFSFLRLLKPNVYLLVPVL
jgi:hypothetical protein